MEIMEGMRKLGLSHHQAKVLLALLRCGEAKASDLSELSGVPSAKIYSVLDQLVDAGVVDKKPGRPIRYKAKPPEEIFERLKQNTKSILEKKLRMFDEVRNELLAGMDKIYSPRETASKDLVKVVRVGEASERETQLMFNEAENEINIISKSLEYYPKIRNELIEAESRGVKIKILLLKDRLSDSSRVIQEKILELIRRDLKAEVKLSKTSLPLRGAIIDPSYEYKSGKAIFVVEDRNTPLYLRDAAITNNPSLVAGIKKYFDLIWLYESES
jgi:sugar-specific transcriptional regulator TrmB